MPYIMQWCGHCKKPTRSQKYFLGDAQDAHDRHLDMLAQEEKHIKTLLLSNLMRLAGDPLPAKLEHGDPC